MKPNFPAFVTGHLAFSPSAFIEAVTAAVLPLIDSDSGTDLQEGKTLADVRDALLPIFGRYTIEDAVYVHQMLRDSEDHWDLKGDDPRAHAIYEAREVLVHFICHAMSSGPACAAARGAFAAGKDGDELPDSLFNALHFRMRNDISHFREGHFEGQHYFDGLW